MTALIAARNRDQERFSPRVPFCGRYRATSVTDRRRELFRRCEPLPHGVAIETMLDFASRHNVTPQTEHFPMSNINGAFARLESGKARYRIVLDADF